MKRVRRWNLLCVKVLTNRKGWGLKIITIKGHGSCVRTGRVFVVGEKVWFIPSVGLVALDALTDKEKMEIVKGTC